MEQKPDISILKAYLDGTCSSEDRASVEFWLNKSPETVDELLALSSKKKVILGDESKDRIKQRLLATIEDDIVDSKSPVKFVSTTSRYSQKGTWLRVAATLVISVLVSMLYFANVLFSSDAVEISMRETSSPSMQITAVTLSDGTKILLNANSTLKYPERFSENHRTVELLGEAFLEVTPDPNRPFHIITGNVTTTVLGTKFNVNYRPIQNKIEVALQEGKVQVTKEADTSSVHEEGIVLNPDEWVSYSYDKNEFTLYKGLGNKLLWKQNILEFEGLTLNEVAQMLETWYGVEVINENSKAGNCTVVGTFENEPLENVLKGLQFVIGIDYEITEDSVLLSGGGCQ